MNTKTYKISLSEEEQKCVKTILSDQDASPQTILRAKILMLSDCTIVPELTILQIAKKIGTSRQTVTKIRNIYHEQGFSVAINALNKGTYEKCPVNDKEFLQKITDLIRSAPPEGRSRWSLRTICAECIKRGYVNYITPTTISDILRKNNIKL